MAPHLAPLCWWPSVWPARSSGIARSPPNCWRTPAAPARAAELLLIGDKGSRAGGFEDLVTSGFGLRMIGPDRRDEAPRHGSIGWIRQRIESGMTPSKVG